MALQFTASREELGTMLEIARRAGRLAEQWGYIGDYSAMEALMDIEVCHCNGCPLKLAELAAADDGNFAHDVFGIRRHIDRETGKLGDCFLPRFAVEPACPYCDRALDGSEAVPGLCDSDDCPRKLAQPEETPDGCTNPAGHEWSYSGTAYGGDDESYHGEGTCRCVYCGADGDA